ncbi:MAG: phosphomannomutase/phosphoglucomutase [Bacteroidales bacterium]|nr:phosphomannomutase/phosphoglucomutase [Bacteroidales bacterium]
MNAFKAYDIRGIYGIDFTSDDCYRIGNNLPSLFSVKKILIGRDVRESSDEIFNNLARGIRDAGADVYDAGITTTPQIYWSTEKFDFGLSVMITASHNPSKYNGMKISRKNALPVGYDSGLKDLEDRLNQQLLNTHEESGHIIPFNKSEDYFRFLATHRPETGKLKIGIDCSNGMAGLYARRLFGDGVLYINENPDGNFPGHDPNPLEEENQEAIKNLVKENSLDIGVIFDGDADRVMFVDENADFIRPDLMIAVLAHYFTDDKLNCKVLQDIRTSKGVTEYLEKMGAEVHMWRVGRAYAALKLREIDGLFGGELAGHYYFKDFNYSDSGILACLMLLKVIADFAEQGITLSKLISRIDVYANSGELNFRIGKKQEAMDAINKHFSSQEIPTAYYDFDGYRVEFSDWWYNIRPSNTEPYLRFLAEAKSTELLRQKLETTREILKKFSN